MTSRDCVVFEAAALFSSRAQVAKLNTGTNEFAVISEMISREPGKFVSEIYGDTPEFAERLADEMANSLTAQIVVNVDSEDDEFEDEDYSVHYEKAPDTKTVASFDDLRAKLEIAPAAVLKAHRVLTTLYAGREDEPDSEHLHLRAAAGVVTWMAMSKWAYDKVDPFTTLGERIEDDVLYAFARGTGLSKAGSDDPLERDKIIENAQRILVEGRFRFMGAYALKFLENFSETVVSPGNFTKEDLRIFRRIYPAQFRATQQNRAASITGMEYALANPYNEDSARTVLQFLAAEHQKTIL